MSRISKGTNAQRLLVATAGLQAFIDGDDDVWQLQGLVYSRSFLEHGLMGLGTAMMNNLEQVPSALPRLFEVFSTDAPAKALVMKMYWYTLDMTELEREPRPTLRRQLSESDHHRLLTVVAAIMGTLSKEKNTDAQVVLSAFIRIVAAL